MLKRLVRLTLIAAVVAAIVYAVRSLNRSQDPLPTMPEPGGEPWPPLRPEPAADSTPRRPAGKREPARAAPRPEPESVPTAPATEPGATWVEASAAGGCPEGYPIKANMNSMIFHSPGQLAYERTHPDRCYASAGAAEADGLRAAKR